MTQVYTLHLLTKPLRYAAGGGEHIANLDCLWAKLLHWVCELLAHTFLLFNLNNVCGCVGLIRAHAFAC